MGLEPEAGWAQMSITSFFNNGKHLVMPGGNFLDTANIYKLGTSEKLLVGWMGQGDHAITGCTSQVFFKDNNTNP